MPLNSLHSVTKRWFIDRYQAPTRVQSLGWPAIASGQDCLIAAPTGSGKTLTAFMVCLDRLLREGLAGELKNETRILYISPLKALSNDIQRNLEQPLAELQAAAEQAGLQPPHISAQVRTGDTKAYQRQSMLKKPPHILVTTPESLFNILTSEKASAMLRTVDTVIIDEIHALARDKRGSHLTLSLARLEHFIMQQPVAHGPQKRPQRIGLSATQKPLDEIAAFLVGQDLTTHTARPCQIIDTGHRRHLDLEIEVPQSELSAVCSHEQWEEVYTRLRELVEGHASTLIFVNTRKLAERVAFHLTQQLGEENVASHHGSMSRERRLEAETRLKSGQLKVIVATASLELGIDVGAIDLVCQVGSPRTIATFLQRVGRSGHAAFKTPKGRLFALTRDELIEDLALLKAVRDGVLDRIEIPTAPLDILAQQIIAACSQRSTSQDGEAHGWLEAELYQLMRSAYPYRDLSQKDYAQVIAMLSIGYADGKKLQAYLHHDKLQSKLRARPGARLAALMSGGAIPEQGEFRVVTEGDGMFVGTLNEDFAIESTAGDVFLLGNTSWQIIAVRGGEVIVRDAQGAPPTVPFWLGEAPGRTIELSAYVSALRQELAERIDINSASQDPHSEPLFAQESVAAIRTLQPPAYAPALKYLAEAQITQNEWAAFQVVHYIAVQKAAVGLVPTQEQIVFERFFDESGGMQLVIHAPFGMRINRGWGLALRKRFCRSFDFELQASADNDGIVLSLGPQHSFPIDSLFQMLSPDNVQALLEQAILQVPLFLIRWRWNSTRSLAVLRQKNGKRVPPALQRFRSDDLLTAVFPAQTQCQEHITGDIELPDHPLVKQTMHDCLHEAIDLVGLKNLLARIRQQDIQLIARDTREPSPFSYQLLNAYPYAFLDGAPLEERRARAVATRRSLSIESMQDLARLDEQVVQKISDEAWPTARDADELHDVLLQIPALPLAANSTPWQTHFAALEKQGRAFSFSVSQQVFWASGENLQLIRAAYAHADGLTLDTAIAEKMDQTYSSLGSWSETPHEWSTENAQVKLIKGYVECRGVITAAAIAQALALPLSQVEASLPALEARGDLLRGRFSGSTDQLEWCERRLLMRIHKLTLDGLRRQIKPVTPAEFFVFLCQHQHLLRRDRAQGKQGLAEVLSQLQGFESAAGAWEGEILAGRVEAYESSWLDELMQSGYAAFARLSPPQIASPDDDTAEEAPTSRIGMSRTAPIAMLVRENIDWLVPVDTHATESRNRLIERLPANARSIYDALQQYGAQFSHELRQRTKLLDSQLDEALGELCRLGLIHADGFAAIRPFVSRNKKALTSTTARRGLPARFQPRAHYQGGGRWAIFPPSSTVDARTDENKKRETRLEAWADLLLLRYGVVFRDLLARENSAPRWSELVPIFRQREARGDLRGGRFVAVPCGEQYALPEIVEQLRQTRQTLDEQKQECIVINAADPLNLFGIILPGTRYASHRSINLAILGGQLVATREGAQIEFLQTLPPQTEQRIRAALQLNGLFRNHTSPGDLTDLDSRRVQ